METCACGSTLAYEKCCQPFHLGKSWPETAEKMMRSRYSAFAKGEVDYIFSTHHPATRGEVTPKEIEDWSKKSKWLGLQVVTCRDGKETDSSGQVEFVAEYEMDGENYKHHEVADFKKQGDRWFFHDGRIVGHSYHRETPKLGRNDPCSCGSGKKFKKCCGA